MNISELIKQLAEVQESHGDLPVFHYDDWDEFSVEEVNVVQELPYDAESVTPKHVLLGRDQHGFGRHIDYLVTARVGNEMR